MNKYEKTMGVVRNVSSLTRSSERENALVMKLLLCDIAESLAIIADCAAEREKRDSDPIGYRLNATVSNAISQ